MIVRKVAHEWLNSLLCNPDRPEKKMESNAVQAEDYAKRLKELEHECTVLNKKVTLKGKEKAEKLKDWTAHDDKVNAIKKKIREIQNKRIIQAETSIKSHTTWLLK